MNLTEVCVKKPVLAWMLMAATIVFGLVAGGRIGISQFPDVDFPTINVSATWEGAAPEVMENEVVEPLEETLVQIEGIRSLTSSSRQGSCYITVEVELSRDVDIALQDVQNKVSQAVRRLPRDMDPPTVSKSNPEDNPIMMIRLGGPYPQRVLSDFVQYGLKEKLQTIPGIGEISLMGTLTRNVRIWLDAAKLDEKNLTVGDVTTALAREHIELPAGRLETPGREVNVRVLGEALDLDTLRKIVVREVSGSPIYLSDVALVEDGFEDIRRIARVDGGPAQGLGVKKQRGANAVALAKRVRAAVDAYRKTLPADMTLGITNDSTKFISDSVNEIEFELLLSVALTAFVCWLFLGSLSSTLNVILAIPMSLLGTVAIIYFLGFTFNTFTLLAMALAVGLVVDDAIMVMENIFRHREGGEGLVPAALNGTKEIAFAALAATLAVVAIFVPVVFMKGIIGRYFLQFGITLCLAVLLSYIEAVTLAPARCSQFLKTTREGRNKVGQAVDRAFGRLERGYGAILRRSLGRPGLILALAGVLFAAAIAVFMVLPSEFVPSQDQSQMSVRIQTAVGSDITETDALLIKAEDVINRHPEVTQIFSFVGGMGGGGVNSGMMFVTLVQPKERRLSQAELSAVVRRELNAIPGIRAVIQDTSQQGFTAQRGFPIEFSVRGADWNELVPLSQKLMQDLTASGLVVDLDSDYRVGMPELRVTPDRAVCADVGVSVDDVATTINALVGGIRVGKYSTGGRRLDVRVKLMAGQRSRPEDISRLRVRARNGELVPLSSLVLFEEQAALQAITRRDRERAISIYANVAPGHAQAEVLRVVEGMGKTLPVGYRVVLGGSSVAFRDSMSSLLFAMGLGILIAYMILASQFNSFKDPVTIITILPLSVAGAAFALLAAGQSLNIFSMIGLLLLMGIVKKNSIILVDYANAFRTQGISARESMEKAGPIRLRPILMTATATLMASIPPALGLGSGSEIRMPMAIAVIGGLVLSTALSLIVVPAFYVVADRLAGRKKSAAAAVAEKE
ncbi:MAG TPA: efflux RND transporter permease subunit [Candidatus Aminicenantes bacterium]|nr:efflux RND transporter permease subunit [Candidatus Aminicenantes bacterium]HRY63835.1 efflux RND transporter permease subunit [Candidatus Aminicenantes bacterium]HRZ70748.1 efflux RND transporter permease subunit [Candidatus Aminicenantes bacterium]